MVKYNKISPNDRQRIIEAHNEDREWRELCKNLGVNVRTAYDWIKNEQEKPKNKGGSKTKKTEEMITIIVDRIQNEPSVTLVQLASLINERFGVSVCAATMKNWLDGELISLKNVRPIIHNVNAPDDKIKRMQYLEALFDARVNGRTLIWIDETNFNLYCRRKEGRSKIGTRAAVVLPSSKGANLHCIGAMSDSRMILFTTRRGAFKHADFNEWVEELLTVCTNQGVERPTLIVDNAPAHARAETVVEGHEDVQLLRLAPYSYLLNPIELVWSVLKSHIKQSMRQRMHEILQIQRARALGIAEQRMRILEELAVESIGRTSGRMLANFAIRVEKYYPSVMRQEDLKELA